MTYIPHGETCSCQPGCLSRVNIQCVVDCVNMLQVLGRLWRFVWWRFSIVSFEAISNKGADHVIPVWWLFQLFCCVTVIIITSAVPADIIVVVTWESDHQLWVGKDLEGGSSVSVNRHSLCTLFQVMQSQTYTILEEKKTEIAAFVNWVYSFSLQEWKWSEMKVK